MYGRREGEFKDMSCSTGADWIMVAAAVRITQAGEMTRFRTGLTHDGFHPMRRMDKAIQRELVYKYKFGSGSPAEYDDRLFGVIEGIAPRRPRREIEVSQLTVGDGSRA